MLPLFASRPPFRTGLPTPQRVGTVVRPATPAFERPVTSVVSHVPVSEVREFRTQGAIGSGFLQAYVDDYWVDLARFPNTQADRFGRLAKYLENLRTDGKVEVDEDTAPKVTHCPKCGQRSPSPTKRARVAFRARQFLRGWATCSGPTERLRWSCAG